MANFNKVILAGNLTRDPELRYTQSGTAITKIGLAINRTWKDQSGEQKTDTTFVDVDSFGSQAEVIAKHFHKGKPILVEGRLKLDTWEDKQSGQNRSKLGVVLEGFQFMDSGKKDEGGGGQQPAPRQSQPKAPSPVQQSPIDDDDVPF